MTDTAIPTTSASLPAIGGPAGAAAVLRLPRLVHFGPGAIASAPSMVASFDERVLVCTDRTMAGTPPFRRLLDALREAGCRVEVYAEGEPELPAATIDAAVRTGSAATPGVIVGYGGGSSIDLAKVTALLLAHLGPISRYYGENLVPGPVVPVVAVPTTAGTGSEVTPVAVVADPDREFKVGVSSPHLIPAAAVVDPDLTRGCPMTVRAHSGADALAHAMEALTAGRRRTDWAAELPVFVGAQLLGDALALEAASVIGLSLRQVVANENDDAARVAMSYGSTCAGMAFGTSGTHLGHALQYSIGKATSTSHGLGVGLLLPYVLAAVHPSSVAPLTRVAEAWGMSVDDPVRAVIGEVAAICAAIGLPASLADLGLAQGDLPRLAEQSATFTRLVANAPVAADGALLLELLRAAWAGDLDLAYELGSTYGGGGR
ncbi:iron-containing alcohol dehydrogenase [Micromonospora sp. NPDC005206]|uniref:iron-containing alcohol dehydrogenase n=1 Tax=Micromonospora sp. NPDC005206 TaxID=3157022 RepID=UPI0033AF2BE1